MARCTGGSAQRRQHARWKSAFALATRSVAVAIVAHAATASCTRPTTSACTSTLRTRLSRKAKLIIYQLNPECQAKQSVLLDNIVEAAPPEQVLFSASEPVQRGESSSKISEKVQLKQEVSYPYIYY